VVRKPGLGELWNQKSEEEKTDSFQAYQSCEKKHSDVTPCDFSTYYR